jgi:serine/threonine protein kinase
MSNPLTNCVSLHCNLFSLDHAHIVSLYDYWEDESTHSLAIEFAVFGDLQNFRQQNTLPPTQIASALEYLLLLVLPIEI